MSLEIEGGPGFARNWKTKMLKSGEFCDDYFISHTAWLLHRDIVLVPVFEQDAYRDGRIVIECNWPDKLPPIYMLFYPETRFVGHYQSIRPIGETVKDNDIPSER